jgi:hypothetical protein
MMQVLVLLVGRAGFEPATNGLKVRFTDDEFQTLTPHSFTVSGQLSACIDVSAPPNITGFAA